MRSKLALFLGLAVFLIHGAYIGKLGWNQGARLGAIFSFVEPGTPVSGTFQVLPYIGQAHSRGLWTWDWAEHEGRYYSNKAPGASFLGVPVYFALYHWQKAFGADPGSREWTTINAHLISLFVSTLCTAFATALFFLFLHHKGLRARDAMLNSLVFAFATLIFPFDTSLWGHTTAAAFLLLAATRLSRTEKMPTIACGFFAGMALLTEYLAGISLVLFALYILYRKSYARRIVYFFAGALPPVLLLLVYQKIAFGGFFVTAFAKSNPLFMGSATDMVGVFSHFSFFTLWDLLFSPFRGLFFFMPILFCAFYRRRWDPYSIFCLLSAALYVLVISLFNAWHGGSSTGPRYLIPAIPFLCLLLPAYSPLKKTPRLFYAVAALLSALHMWAITLVDIMIDPGEKNPLFHVIYPELFGARGSEEWQFLLTAPKPAAALLSLAMLAGVCAALLRAARKA